MTELFDINDLKAFMDIEQSDTTQDGVLIPIVEGVNSAVCQQNSRIADILSTESDEFYDGPGRPWLLLHRRPVTAIAGVWSDPTGYGGYGTDAFAASTELTIGVHWFPRSLAESEDNPGILEYIGGCWAAGRQNIKVTYTAGYTQVPKDIVLACCQVAVAVNERTDKTGPIASETIGRYAYTLMTSAEAQASFLADPMRVFNSYSEISLGF